MVTRFTIVEDDDSNEDRDESDVPAEERAITIVNLEKQHMIMDAARGMGNGELAEKYGYKRQSMANFRHRHRRRIAEMRRILVSKVADLYYYQQHFRVTEAERHLAMIDDQIEEMLTAAAAEGDNHVPLDRKELRGMIAEASKLRKEIREEFKPTMTLGDIQLTPRNYGGVDPNSIFQNPKDNQR